MSQSAPPRTDELRARLDVLGPADRRRFGKRLAGARRIRDRGTRAAALGDLTAQVERAERRLDRRRAVVPTLTFPPELPVSDRVDDLAAAIAEHQVVIVAGETGSGKSTQLPKIALKIGRGVGGMIGHTQPRRIAARALAERIAEETGTEVGGAVGYSIRFGDHTGPDTLVKLMTDGILLAEIHRDPDLLAYDTIILDEAHERSLNIDFLIGYLTRLLPRRPDLKVIITSATIDPGRFSRHFGDAPVVEVSGRTYPVEIRYRPYGVDDNDDEDDDPDRPPARHLKPDDAGQRAGVDQAQAICDAVDELSVAGDGDILVFLSGEREITDTADVLRGHLAGRRGSTEVLPLYGRLSTADQHKVFSTHAGRRIVLATNVAETSLTVPGIRYVIDPGTARISRYSTRTKVQRLPIEKISQASAGQRAGRCGRVADGICVRLYAQDDFESRPQYTDPEIARTSLASVILQMAALGLGDIATFPFLEPPDAKQIKDGLSVLSELGAIDADGRLTRIGRSVAALPVDPRLARMIVEADHRNCLAEVLVIVAALAIQDVREYPLEDRDKATAAHSRFTDPKSDFMALLGLWQYLQTQTKALSGNAFRRMCRSEYLHYLRIREWQDLHSQLSGVAKGLGLNTSRGIGERAASGSPAKTKAGSANATQQGRGSLAVQGVDGQAVHTALLSGLLSHVGLKTENDKDPSGKSRRFGSSREYQGARGTSFVIWPGSATAKNPPKLVVAAELVETSRLWGRSVAAVEPDWVEQVGGDLLRRSYSEPRWDAKRAAVMATEKVTLLGVTLIGARSVQFDRVDPVTARELFIRHALVEGDWETRHAFFAINQRARDEVAEREDRARRRDILLDDESLFALYDARIPAEVTSVRHFDSWWRKVSREDPGLLTFTPEMLIAAGATDVDTAAYPDRYTTQSVDLPLDYVFDPTRADDGVSVTIPLAVLARVDPSAFGAQIPGLRRDLAIALLRSLPKTLRRNFVPAGDFADAALAGMPSEAGARPSELAARLTAMTGIVVGESDFDLERVPDHLRMTYKVVDDRGQEVAQGKDLAALQSGLRSQGRTAVAKATGAIERTGLTEFPAAGVPSRLDTEVDGQRVVGFPALTDEGRAATPSTPAAPPSVGIRVYTNETDQRRAMRAGTRRLLTIALPPPVSQVRKGLTRAQQLTLSAHGDLGALLADAAEAAIDALLDWAGGPAYTADRFAALRERIAGALPKAAFEIVVATEDALRAAHGAALAIDALAGSVPREQITDMRDELAGATGPGFITRTTAAHLPDLTRSMTALRIRAERAAENPQRDLVRMAEVNRMRDLVEGAVERLRPERHRDADVFELRRLVSEFRIMTFAQPMRTSVPVSHKRITAAVATLAE